jgi:hypothetical protein
MYWNILTMHGPINVKFPNNTSKWQMGFNSAFKGLRMPHKSTVANDVKPDSLFVPRKWRELEL